MAVYRKQDFRRWYRSARPIRSAAELTRSAALAVAITEWVLGRRVRSVLDVGAGTGEWRAVLRRLRPRVRYAGVEPSEWAVRTFGRRRELIPGTFGGLADLALRANWDLVLCVDVIHYLTRAELARGLSAVARLAPGVLYAPVLTARDNPEGDLRGFRRRRARWYRDRFAEHGFVHLGLHAWVLEDAARELDEMAVSKP